MSKQIAIRAFFSYIGYDNNGIEISYGDGELSGKDLSRVREICLENAKTHNKNVARIHLIAVTPLEFKEERYEPKNTRV